MSRGRAKKEGPRLEREAAHAERGRPRPCRREATTRKRKKKKVPKEKKRKTGRGAESPESRENAGHPAALQLVSVVEDCKDCRSVGGLGAHLDIFKAMRKGMQEKTGRLRFQRRALHVMSFLSLCFWLALPLKLCCRPAPVRRRVASRDCRCLSVVQPFTRKTRNRATVALHSTLRLYTTE